jgi:hypothetical protein
VAHMPSRSSRRYVSPVRGMFLLVGAAAVLGAGVLVLQHTGSTPTVAVEGRQAANTSSSSGCNAIHRQIAARGAVDVGAAQLCDQAEFGTLENARQAARHKGQKPAMQISQTCRLVDQRAAQGDQSLNFTLAFGCRQRERFANEVNARNGLGPAGKITSLCLGAQAREARGDAVDTFTRTFCSQERAAAAPVPTTSTPAPIRTTAPVSSRPTAPAVSPTPAAGGGATRTCTATFVLGGGITANGETNDPKALIAGSSIFPFGTKVQVTNPDTGKSVIVRINDRNTFCVAMSETAFAQIRTPGKNLIRNAQVRALN